jgi:hypothetical protein
LGVTLQLLPKRSRGDPLAGGGNDDCLDFFLTYRLGPAEPGFPRFERMPEKKFCLGVDCS